GLPGLEYMIHRYRKNEIKKQNILLRMIAGHANAPDKSTEILEFLTSALKHTNHKMRFAAVVSLMDNSPLRAKNLSKTPLDTDYELIYAMVLPVAIELQKEGGQYEDWGLRYAEMIKTRNENSA
ncbi:MAG: hypothetical protein AAGD28_05070, partial [Bacteroidota bacterium]